MSQGLTPWQMATISGLGALAAGLVLFLLGVIVQEMREGGAERREIRAALREHMVNQRAHGAIQPTYPPKWRPR